MVEHHHMRNQQLNFFKDKTDLTHGGSKAKGKRKSLRPLSTKLPIHLVLKAISPYLLLRNTEMIEYTIRKYAKQFGVTIYEIAVQADHIHLSFKAPSRELYQRWIRAITSVLTLKIKKLKWSLLPFTRIGTWGRDFKRLATYIQRNKSEGSFLLHAHTRVEQFQHEQLVASPPKQSRPRPTIHH